MLVIYRDNIGLVSVETDDNYNIAFLDGVAFFDGANGTGYRIPVNQIVAIDIKREDF